MAILRDRIIVIDIEATCWDIEPPPAGQFNEIIEVGLCTYDVATDGISGKRSILVKPITSEISAFCTELTSLTPYQIAEAGLDFAQTCRVLVEEYKVRKYIWASWGSYDRKLFRKQCRRLGVSYPFGDKHLNLRSAFAECHDGRRLGMLAALRLAGIEPTGTLHRGADDAWNIARLLQYLIHRQGNTFLETLW